MDDGGVCWSCRSNNVTELETVVHLHPAPKNGLGKPFPSASPKTVMCLDCGYMRFNLSEAELRQLKEATSQP